MKNYKWKLIRENAYKWDLFKVILILTIKKLLIQA
jgi:hypothetical protein